MATLKTSLKYLKSNNLSKSLKISYNFGDYLREHDKKFGESPSENLLGKALKQPFDLKMRKVQIEEIKKLKKEIDLKIDYKNEVASTEKQENYPLTNTEYNNFRKKNPYGKVNIMNYNGTQYTLVGTQFQFLPIKNIYKLLKASKPEVICLQVRPDQILRNFVVNIKKPDSEYFSTSRYFRQILKKGFEIMPSSLHRKKVQQELLMNNIYLKRIDNTDEEYYEEYMQEIKKQFKPYDHKDRLSLDTIATACFYAERNNIPIVLCDLPEIIHRQDIANQHTLMQLQHMLTRCSRMISREPDLQPHTPLSIAYNIHGEEFLGKSDQYMASVFQYLNLNNVKRVTALVGNTQSESLDEIMTYREENDISDHLVPKNVQHGLLRDITAEEILEKHSILDVMHHGKNIVQDFENLEFSSTYEMINRYGDPSYVDRSVLNKLRYMHYSFIQKYQKFCEDEYKEGEKQLRREFLKRVGY